MRVTYGPCLRNSEKKEEDRLHLSRVHDCNRRVTWFLYKLEFPSKQTNRDPTSTLSRFGSNGFLNDDDYRHPVSSTRRIILSYWYHPVRTCIRIYTVYLFISNPYRDFPISFRRDFKIFSIYMYMYIPIQAITSSSFFCYYISETAVSYYIVL